MTSTAPFTYPGGAPSDIARGRLNIAPVTYHGWKALLRSGPQPEAGAINTAWWISIPAIWIRTGRIGLDVVSSTVVTKPLQCPAPEPPPGTRSLTPPTGASALPRRCRWFLTCVSGVGAPADLSAASVCSPEAEVSRWRAARLRTHGAAAWP